jgi:hypothetical protein
LGTCIVSMFQYTCISKKMQRYTVYLYLETALHVLTCICLTARLFRMTLVTAQVRDVTPGPLTVTDTCIMYRLTNFDASQNVILHMRYVSTCVGERVVGVGK